MPKVFISHSTKDKALARGIFAILQADGYTQDLLFLDSDEDAGIELGRQWEPQLFEALFDCACLIVVVSPSWEKSSWCFAEAFVAKGLNRPILPICRPTDTVPKRIEEYQSIKDFQLDDPMSRDRLLNALSKLQLKPPKNGMVTSGWEPRPVTTHDLTQVVQELNKGQGGIAFRTKLILVVLAILCLLTLVPIANTFWPQINAWLFPAPTVVLSTAEFIDDVVDPAQREKIIGKRIERLTGKPIGRYSASLPRLIVGPKVEVNINEMSGDEPIPETLPDDVSFTCEVVSINPIRVGAEVKVHVVYVTNFELLNP